MSFTLDSNNMSELEGSHAASRTEQQELLHKKNQQNLVEADSRGQEIRQISRKSTDSTKNQTRRAPRVTKSSPTKLGAGCALVDFIRLDTDSR